MIKFEERPSGSPEHLGKVDVQNVRAGVPGQPFDQVFLRITITVGQVIGGCVGCILRGPLDPNAGRQLIRVGRVQQPVHRVHQLTVQVVRHRRRRGYRLIGTCDGHGAVERDGHYQSGRVCGPVHRGAAYISLSLCIDFVAVIAVKRVRIVQVRLRMSSYRRPRRLLDDVC